MQHSSRKNPCPICSRNVDDKCRWSSTRIFCYVGNTFSPPSHLRLGDIIKVDGEDWRLLSYNAGFSRNSYVFALSLGTDYRYLSFEDKREFRRKCIRATRDFLAQQSVAERLMSELQSENDFCQMNLDSFYKNKGIAQKLISECTNLMTAWAINKRYLLASSLRPDPSKLLMQTARAKLKEIHSFERMAFNAQSPEKQDLRPEHCWF